MLSILLLGFINLVNSIAIRQYSDDGCSLLSRIDYLDNSNCYSFVSTGSYLIKTCNCSLVEYALLTITPTLLTSVFNIFSSCFIP